MDSFITIRDLQILAEDHLEHENKDARRLAFALKDLSNRYLDLLHSDILKLQRSAEFEAGCG